MRKFRSKAKDSVYFSTFVYKKVGKKMPIIEENFVFFNNQKTNRGLQKSLGDMAIFTADYMNDYKQADNFFRLTIEKNPNNTYWLSNYAIFLHYYMGKYDQAREFYRRSLKLDRKDAFVLYNYAMLETFVFRNYDLAEKLFRKAAKFQQKKYLISYANFLFKIKQNYAEAEKILHKLFINSPKNTYVLSSYAHLKLYQEDYESASNFIDLAFKYNPPDEVALELWFFRYCHFPNWLAKAEYEIELLLKRNVKSMGWGYGKDVISALFRGHPNPLKLDVYSKMIEGTIKL